MRCPEVSPNVAILITDGVYNTELTAPMDIFEHTKYRCENGMHVYTLTNTGFAVTTSEGLKIIPDLNYYSDSLPDFDVLVIPAAEDHLTDALQNDSLLLIINRLGAKADYVISLCDGAFPLAASGLISGRNATTFPSDQDAFERRFGEVSVHRNVNFVRDGKFITSIGGAKSFEACLYLVEQLYGVEGAQKTAEGMALDWPQAELKYLEFLD